MMSLCINFSLFSLVILLRNHIILGVNVTVTADTKVCAGNNITVTCSIDPFTSPPSATWNRNGSALTTCTSGSICTTDSLIINGIKYSFFGGTNGITVSLQVQQVEDGIQWNCVHNNIPFPYTFGVLNECEVTTERSTEGNSLCVGIRDAVAALSIPSACSEGARVVICIIIYCLCTQKVTITATADKNTKLKSAKQIIIKGKQQSANLISANRMLGKGKPEQIPIIQNKKCSIVALGGESHECIFETDAGVLTLTFKIKDDLLNVIPGQTIYLPTLLTVDPKYSTIQWDHNGRGFQNDSLYFTTKVTRSKYGVYNIKMKFEDLGLTILIENMRVRGVYWILIVISVPINVLCGVIGVAITGNFRSTDGYCISEIPIVILAVLCVIVNGFLIVVLVYNLFKRRTGNEKNSRPKPANDVTTPPTPSTTSTVSPTIVTSASVTSAKTPSAVETTYSTSGTSPSAVITAYSTDRDRRNQKPSNLPDGYDPQISLRNISGNDQMLKENAEQKNLLDRKL